MRRAASLKVRVLCAFVVLGEIGPGAVRRRRRSAGRRRRAGRLPTHGNSGVCTLPEKVLFSLRWRRYRVIHFMCRRLHSVSRRSLATLATLRL